jgi:hypothetical protein
MFLPDRSSILNQLSSWSFAWLHVGRLVIFWFSHSGFYLVLFYTRHCVARQPGIIHFIAFSFLEPTRSYAMYVVTRCAVHDIISTSTGRRSLRRVQATHQTVACYCFALVAVCCQPEHHAIPIVASSSSFAVCCQPMHHAI